MTTCKLDLPQKIDVYAYLLDAIDGSAFLKSLAAYPAPTQKSMVRFLRKVASHSGRRLTDEQKLFVRQYYARPLTEPFADDGC